MHVHGMLRLLLAKASASRLPMIVVDGDIKSAFDSMSLAEIAVALTDVGLPAGVQVALLAEYEKLVASARVADAPPSADLPFTRGGREWGW